MQHASCTDWSDPRAFTIAYQQLAPGLRRFVGRIIVDKHLAEDVANEAFLELWQHPTRYDPERVDLQSWLRTVAHRRAIDRIRSLEASRKRDTRIGIRDYHDVDHTGDQWDALFVRTTLHAALAELSDKQRDAVVLRYLGERNTSELAGELGVTIGTAKTRVRSGLIALRAHLQADITPAA